MKKIININLSGRVIPIEDSAYEKLQGYIESLRRYFSHEEGRDEIINDIESRIAELMNEKVRKGAACVTDADIDEIMTLTQRMQRIQQSLHRKDNNSNIPVRKQKRKKGCIVTAAINSLVVFAVVLPLILMLIRLL
jgi:DNA replication initiation complex subunit (GINS family)